MILFEIPFSKLDLPSKLPHSNGTRRCRNGGRKLANPKSSQTTTKESNTASAVQWKHSKHSTQILDPHQTGNGDNLLHSLPHGWWILAYRDDGGGDGAKVFPVQRIERGRDRVVQFAKQKLSLAVFHRVSSFPKWDLRWLKVPFIRKDLCGGEQRCTLVVVCGSQSCVNNRVPLSTMMTRTI